MSLSKEGGKGIFALQDMDNSSYTWQSIRQGSKTAFEQLFREQYDPLCRYAFKFTNDSDEAEEIVQEMFLKLWEKKEEIQINSTAVGYLFRSVQHRCLNRIKHLRVRDDYQKEMAGMHSTGLQTEQEVNRRELQKMINKSLDNLPEQCGIVFKMSRQDGLKYQEIADELNISVKTVENHMGKALRLLRVNLKEYLPTLLWITIFIP